MIEYSHMKKDYKIIFTDIDWTIFDHSNGDHVFDVESINALKKVQEKGIKVFLCTARPLHTVKQIGLLDLITPDGMILCNGGLTLYQNKVINEKPITPSIFEKICEVVLSHGLTLEATEPFSRFLIAPKNEMVDFVFESFYEEVPPVEDYHNRHVISAMLFAGKEYDEILVQELPKEVNYFRFHDYGVDVLDVIHDKGESVKFVIDYFGYKKENAIAFGDDVADISMFKEVGTSICMENGKDESKENASIVTTHVWNHGVKDALKKLKIID